MGPDKYDQARSIHKNLRPYEWRFGENRTLHGGPYGNMTLSRLPIKFCRNYDISWRNRERRVAFARTFWLRAAWCCTFSMFI